MYTAPAPAPSAMSAVSVSAAILGPRRRASGSGPGGADQSSGQSGSWWSGGKSASECIARRWRSAGCTPVTPAGTEPFRRAAHGRSIAVVMPEWWSIEVLHGEFSAFQWQRAHDSELIEAALTNGALDGTWHAETWGVAFEVCFNTPH